MSQTMGCNEPLPADMQRVQRLSELVFADGSKLTIDTLLDGFKVLYEECSAPSLRTNKNVALFIERFGDVIPKIQKLRFSPDDFQSVQVIGRGEFGEVHLVRSKIDGKVYAMKLLNKVEICRALDKTSYWEERDVMAHNIDSDRIVRLDYAFQDDTYLYLVMEFVPGGDLFALIAKHDRISEEWARFYIMEAVLAVQSLHDRNYCHRDIKPDNLMIDMRGHIKLADFGSTAWLGADGVIRCSTAVGTPDYVSPEVLASQGGSSGYTKACDWWSLGIVLYELLVGETPFASESLSELYGRIAHHETSLHWPDDVELSDSVKDLVGKLLTDAGKRITYEQIVAHPWFKGHSWDKVGNYEVKPPYIPELQSPTDTRHFDDILDKPVSKESFAASKGFSGNHLPFVGFTFSRAAKWGHLVARGQPQLPGVAATSAASTASASAAAAAVSTKPMDVTGVPLTAAHTQELERKDREIRELLAKAEKAAGDAATARKAAQAAEAKIEDLERDLVRRDKDTQAATRALERKEKSLRDLMTEIEQKTQEASREKAKAAKADDRAKRAEERVEELTAQLDATRSQQHEGRARAVSESRSAQQSLKDEIAALKTKAAQAVQELAAAADQIRTLEREKAGIEAERQSLVSVKARIEQMAAESAAQADKYGESGNRFKSELDALRGEFEAYKTAAEVRAGQMAHEAKELQAQAAKQQGEMKALHAENHALLQRKEDAERRAVLAKAEAERAAKELSNWQQSAERSSSQTQQANEQTIRALQSDVARLTMLNSVAESNHEQQQQRTVKLQQEKEALEHGRRALEQEVAGLKSEKNTAQQEAARAQARLQAVEDKLRTLETDRHALEKKVKEYEADLKWHEDRFTQLSQERTDLVTEITTARRKIDDLQARAASLEAEATTLRRENEEYKARESQAGSDADDGARVEQLEAEITAIRDKLGAQQAREYERDRAHADELAQVEAEREHLVRRIRQLEDEIAQERASEVERAEKLQAELERERDKTRQMADTLNMRTDESNCFERAYQLHLSGGLRPDEDEKAKLSSGTRKEGPAEARLRKEYHSAMAKLKDEERERLKAQEQLGTVQHELDEALEAIAAMKAEREEWEAKRQSSSASAQDVRSPAVNRSVRSAIAAAGSLQSSSSTSLGSSTAVAGLGLLYENGVARGTAKVPRGKNLKGDWEKRYLVFEDSIRYLNIYKEDPDKQRRGDKAGDKLQIHLKAVLVLRRPGPGDLYQLNKDAVATVLDIKYDPRVGNNKFGKDLRQTHSTDSLGSAGKGGAKHDLKKHHVGMIKMLQCSECKSGIYGDYVKCQAKGCKALAHPACEIKGACYADYMEQVYLQFSDEATRDKWFDILKGKHEEVRQQEGMRQLNSSREFFPAQGSGIA